MEDREFYELYPYVVPPWAANLKNIPKQYIKLSNLNTPIHKWNLQDVPEGYTIHIKRDDLTGAELTGNKVRMLQIMLAEAVREDSKHVLTAGIPESCMCRALALACRSIGLTPHLLIVSKKFQKEEVACKGDALLYRLAGSHIYLAPPAAMGDFRERLVKMKDYISARYNENCYVVPAGGTSVKGLFGFISLFQEMIDQGLFERFDDIVLGISTSPTSLGLAIGNYLTGSKVKLHSVMISMPRPLLLEIMNGLLEEIGLPEVNAEDIIDIIDGYNVSDDHLMDFIGKVSSTTGMLLSSHYTAKAARAMTEELKKNPDRFKGNRILFIHTGGVFGLFDGEIDEVVNREGLPYSNISLWEDSDRPPWEMSGQAEVSNI